MKRSIKSIVLPIGVASALLVTPTTSHAHSDPTTIVEKHGLLQLTDGGLLDGLVAELLGNGQLVNDLLGKKGLINLTNLIGQEGVVGGMLSKERVIGALLDDVLGKKGLVHRLLGNVALKDVSVTQLLDGILSAERGVLEPIREQKGLLGSLLGLNGKGGLLGGLLGKEGLLGGLFGRS